MEHAFCRNHLQLYSFCPSPFSNLHSVNAPSAISSIKSLHISYLLHEIDVYWSTLVAHSTSLIIQQSWTCWSPISMSITQYLRKYLRVHEKIKPSLQRELMHAKLDHSSQTEHKRHTHISSDTYHFLKKSDTYHERIIFLKRQSINDEHVHRPKSILMVHDRNTLAFASSSSASWSSTFMCWERIPTWDYM